MRRSADGGADGRYVAVGTTEPQFLARLLDRLGLPAELGEPAAAHTAPDGWAQLREQLAMTFRTPHPQLDRASRVRARSRPRSTSA